MSKYKQDKLKNILIAKNKSKILNIVCDIDIDNYLSKIINRKNDPASFEISQHTR